MAAFLGIDEHNLRDVVAGARPLTEERLRACPVAVQRAYHAARLRELEDDAPLSGMGPERHHTLISSRVGALAEEIRTAVVDGVVDEVERARIVRAAESLEGAVHTMVTEMLRGRP